jgi:hypothetical protein
MPMSAAIQARASDDSSNRRSKKDGRPTDTGKRANPAKAGEQERSWSPLRWIQAVLRRPVKIKRIGLQLHVVLEEPSSTPQGSKTPGRGEALRLAHVALQGLLAQHEGARQLFPHLSHMEQALARHGSKALVTTPISVLQRAMDQLDNLEGTVRAHDLMTLRLRVDEAIKRRTPVNMRGDLSSIEVTDASHSQFDKAESQWTGRVPLDAAPEPASARR